jgi:hypothetical protein
MDGIQTYGSVYDLKMMVAHAWTNLRVSTLRYKAVLLIILQETESTPRNQALRSSESVCAES